MMNNINTQGNDEVNSSFYMPQLAEEMSMIKRNSIRNEAFLPL